MRPTNVLPAAVLGIAAFAAGASVQVVTDADWAPTSRPRDMDGSWFGRIVRAEDESLEGSEVMYAGHPRVLRNVILRFDASNPDEIASAALNEYGGVRERDGGYLLRGKNVAVTADGFMTAGDDVGCVSVTFDDTKETMYAYAKSSGVDAFEQCPAVPDPEAFENDAVDLEAAGADRAVILKRARLALVDESFGLSASADDRDYDATWPRGMPGLWRGTMVVSDPKYVSIAGATPAYLSVFQNLAPNAWLFLDPNDETKIVSANVGLMRSVVAADAEDGSFEFHNEAWKSFPGPEHVAGRDDWCNAFVLVKKREGDEIVMLSNSRAHAEGDHDVAPECPAAPDAATLDASVGEGDETAAMLAERGAVSAARMTKQ